MTRLHYEVGGLTSDIDNQRYPGLKSSTIDDAIRLGVFKASPEKHFVSIFKLYFKFFLGTSCINNQRYSESNSSTINDAIM